MKLRYSGGEWLTRYPFHNKLLDESIFTSQMLFDAIWVTLKYDGIYLIVPGMQNHSKHRLYKLFSKKQ